jgi:RNA polymerase sigma-70 factor (ECF subfamily)
LPELSDEELCRKAAARDRGAFDQLVERHQARAFRLARSVLGNDADARDVSQDAFIRLYESAHQFDGRSRFSTWFHRILINLCIDYQRRTKWWRRMLPLASPSDDPQEPGIDPPSEEPGPELEAMQSESVAKLDEAFKRLSSKQRIAVTLQAQEGLSSREIAAVLNCSDNTARVHIFRGLTQLRKILKEG